MELKSTATTQSTYSEQKWVICTVSSSSSRSIGSGWWTGIGSCIIGCLEKHIDHCTAA